MTTKVRNVTIVIHVDGELKRRQYQVPLRLFRLGQGAAIVLGLLLLVFLAFAVPITRNAARVPGLEGEVARLRAENARVQELAAALNRAEASYQELRQILAARAPAGSRIPAAPTLARARAIDASIPSLASRFENGPSVPRHWPLDEPGFVTRGQVRPGDGAESHPGLDIAIPPGTPVRAAGGGTVILTGADPDYGIFVRLRHPDGYETMYGHTSRLLVRDGERVSAGQVIALSGNTGRSTAPHLHFEILRAGRSLDPLTLVKETT